MSDQQPEFWEAAFHEKGEMWGEAPSQSAIMASELFLKNGVSKVLVPGMGYGRNAHLFVEHGMRVTGIEISPTAIGMARQRYGDSMKMYPGSVIDMPFDDQKYDGIFCYALIHLLDESERRKLIRDCYIQAEEGGYMVFTTVTKEADIYGQGKQVSKDRYELFGGVNMFFYDEESVHKEFGEAGLISIERVMETYPFFYIVCKK